MNSIRNAIVSAAAIAVLAAAGYSGWRALDVPAAKDDPRLASIMTLAVARIP